ncbi:VOC family protein [Brevundimonas sp.]|uniref:VOC family protein n=1 Tax=Brevundimonas sp. TaxID=1871086 RepID=UPI002AB812DE|nr:VOC family protein [Brevundimonas sp.]MDZ4363262.1 VOC family protein [Brevundimonas sp.]
MAMRLLHFGFAVRDVEATTTAWRELFGIDWEPVARHALPDPDQGADHVSLVTHGRTGDGVEIEMVQTVSGRTVDAQVFGDREGVSHVAFQVDDLATERARMIAAGVEVVDEGSAPRADWVFLRDPRLGGALVQLVQLRRP